MSYAKPLPKLTDEDRFWWDAIREHRFVLPACQSCGHLFFPPYGSCPSCLSFDIGLTDASGDATVWGVTLMRQPYLPGFADELPYNVALVELAEGPMMYTNIVGADGPELRPGLAVEAVFHDVTETITLVKFQPRA